MSLPSAPTAEIEGTKAQREAKVAHFIEDDGTGGLTRRIIGAAITVHRHLGPGLIEKAYERCLDAELRHLGITVDRQVEVSLDYRDVHLERSFRIDLWVERSVVVEIKSVSRLRPVHMAQVQTYLRLTDTQVGLLFNFNVEALVAGGFRRILRARQ
jgi:GxxExxY protein